jgi:hypothetical protein
MNFTDRFGLLLSLFLSAMAPLAQTPRDPARPLALSPQRSVVCGMTILSGATTPDSRMAKRPPAGVFTMRVPQPTMCRDESRAPSAKEMPKDFLNRLPTFLGPKR